MNSRYDDPKRLSRFGFQVNSQNEEDGIIAEIFKRIGTTDRFFVEFGVEDGLECNSAYLLTEGWKGMWIEADRDAVKSIRNRFDFWIRRGELKVQQQFITAENIETLFRQGGVPDEFDLLSIDIDGNDYWVWKAITTYKPRVVIIEYNAVFPPTKRWIVKYNPDAVLGRDSYFGASLKSMELLGAVKGYKLVGCNFTGANAFFVREDLAHDLFCEPYTAEKHYEPPRYFLMRAFGYQRGFGEFSLD